MKEFLEYILKAIVDSPNDVNVSEIAGESATVFEIKVATPDAGKVIGKHGRIINAIRTVIRASAKDGRKISIELIG